MKLKYEDVVLKESITLYNNIANFNEQLGRLQATLDVYPLPNIRWDFETFERFSEDIALAQSTHSFIGKGFRIDTPLVTRKQEGNSLGQPYLSLRGVANNVQMGESDLEADSITFYMPNARFHREAYKNQRFLTAVTQFHDDPKSDLGLKSDGKYIELSVDSDWNISFYTNETALDWLSSRSSSFGTLITTQCGLYPKHRKSDEENRRHISIDEANRKLSLISLLLSFANGGYINPILLHSSAVNENRVHHAYYALIHETTPIEQLGTTWFVDESDLGSLLRCSSALERMLADDLWRESLPLVMIWYFQAIQPENFQRRRKPWPVIANALGAALERLSFAIVVKEMGIRRLSNAHQKIEKLLEVSGLLGGSWAHREQAVGEFVALRNDATHPKTARVTPDHQIRNLLETAIQWVEEILLWRLGYEGVHFARTLPAYKEIPVGYDLNTRLSNW